MPRGWHVVLAAPDGYDHWRVFIEPAALLQAALTDLGRDCTLAVNELDQARINVVLGYHLIANPAVLADADVVLYQLEQLGPGGGLFDCPRAREMLRSAALVWDFSRRNAEALAAEGIDAVVLPIGYHPSLEVLPARQPDIDVLFVGSVTPRRREVLGSLGRAGVQGETLFGAYGAEKQAALARARIHLHVHAMDASLFQQPRIAHLLNNRCFIVTETAADDPYPLVDLVQADASDLADVCRHYLAHPDEREEVAQRTHEQFKASYAMVDLVRPAVEEAERRL